MRLEAVGFTAGASVDVGFGPPESEYEVVASAEADGSGAVTTRQPVPAWAEPGRSYVWVLAVPRGGARAVSDAFAVAAGEATVRVEGRLTDEGVECPGVRADDGTLYTLAGGDTAGMEPGTRVVVTGTVAGMSICQQGVTLSVHTLERG